MKYRKILLTTIMVILIGSISAAATTLSIESTTAAQNGVRNTSIIVSNVSNLANFGLTLSYNSSVVHVTDVYFNPSLKSTQKLINNATGSATIWTEETSSPPSLIGNVTLVNITLRATGTPISVSHLNMSKVTMDDPEGDPITVTQIINGTFTIVPKGDVDSYPGITMADAMYIGKAVLSKPGFLLDTTTMDVDGLPGVTLNDALHLAKYVIGVPGYTI